MNVRPHARQRARCAPAPVHPCLQTRSLPQCAQVWTMVVESILDHRLKSAAHNKEVNTTYLFIDNLGDHLRELKALARETLI